MFMFWYGRKRILPFLTELLLIVLVIFLFCFVLLFFFHNSIIWSIFKWAVCKQNILFAFLQIAKLLKNYYLGARPGWSIHYLQFGMVRYFTRSLGRGEHISNLEESCLYILSNLDTEPLYTLTNLPVLWQMFLGNNC